MRKFKDVLHEDLKDPLEVKAYLEVALEDYEEDGNVEAFLMALRDVAITKSAATKQIENQEAGN